MQVAFLVLFVASLAAMAAESQPKLAPEDVSSEQTSPETDVVEEVKPLVEMVRVEPGSFSMGFKEKKDRAINGEVYREVTITKPYLMSKTEISQEFYQRVMGTNPSVLHPDEKDWPAVGPDLPVHNVGWMDAVRFANTLSELEGLQPVYTIGEFEKKVYKNDWSDPIEAEVTSVEWNLDANGYRLPTSAEWHHAAFTDTGLPWPWTEKPEEVCAYANIKDQSLWAVEWAKALEDVHTDHDAKYEEKESVFPCDDGHVGLAPVGSYKANAFGLHDMGGNAGEWAWDLHGPHEAKEIDPRGPDMASALKRASEGDWLDWPRRTYRDGWGFGSGKRLGAVRHEGVTIIEPRKKGSVTDVFIGIRLARSL